MENIIKNIWTIENIKTSLFNIIGLTTIYLIPALSHVFALPIYYIEPMRLMLILAIVHTTKKNAYLVAITLPIFSSVVSLHPTIIKTGLIALELTLNVWLFYTLSKHIKNYFGAMMLSILLSKICYYLIKFMLIKIALMNTALVSTPILIQAITMVAFTSFAYFMLKIKNIK